ncbi:MAG: outer membrane beta-barrel protein [Chlorobiales bacterium]|jgi:hypothetical protein|nr:outer membrane beta-barrel protein [Chlorobiales bacterium]
MKKILLLLATLLCFASAANAQVTKPLSIQGGIGGGLSSGKSDFTAYEGYNIGGKLKLGFSSVPFTIVGDLVYNEVERENLEVHKKFFSVGAGIEYQILNTPIISPYVSADAAMNFFFGDNTQKFNRIGAGIGVGTEITIPVLPVNFDVEAKYRYDNLFGKEVGEPTINHIHLWAQILFPLN